MAKDGVKKDKGWSGWRMAIDPKGFQREIQKQMGRATRNLGAAGERLVKKTIQKGITPANHALTAAIKGSTKPLIDSSDLWNAITWTAIDWATVFVGVKREDENFNVAKAVHFGCEIPVTAAMRHLFWILSQVSDREMDASKLTSQRARDLWERYKHWRPMKAGTSIITIPSRPFMTLAFRDKDTHAMALRYWEKAVKRTIEGRSRKGRKKR